MIEWCYKNCLTLMWRHLWNHSTLERHRLLCVTPSIWQNCIIYQKSFLCPPSFYIIIMSFLLIRHECMWDILSEWCCCHMFKKRAISSEIKIHSSVFLSSIEENNKKIASDRKMVYYNVWYLVCHPKTNIHTHKLWGDKKSQLPFSLSHNVLIGAIFSLSIICEFVWTMASNKLIGAFRVSIASSLSLFRIVLWGKFEFLFRKISMEVEWQKKATKTCFISD